MKSQDDRYWIQKGIYRWSQTAYSCQSKTKSSTSFKAFLVWRLTKEKVLENVNSSPTTTAKTNRTATNWEGLSSSRLRVLLRIERLIPKLSSEPKPENGREARPMKDNPRETVLERAGRRRGSQRADSGEDCTVVLTLLSQFTSPSIQLLSSNHLFNYDLGCSDFFEVRWILVS